MSTFLFAGCFKKGGCVLRSITTRINDAGGGSSVFSRIFKNLTDLTKSSSEEAIEEPFRGNFNKTEEVKGEEFWRDF